MNVKKLYIVVSFLALVCGCSREHHAKDHREDYETEVDAIDTVATGYQTSYEELAIHEKIQRICDQLGIQDSIELINFYEEKIDDVVAYDYAFKILADSSIFHSRYITRLKFDLEKELRYSSYGSSDRWASTDRVVKYDLNTNHSRILQKWIPVYYYRGELTLYDPSDFHGGYYLFTDTLIFDNSFMDGPYIYRYHSVESPSSDRVLVDFQDVLGKDRLAIEFFFLAPDLAVIKHEGRYLDNETGFTLAVPVSSIYKYPIIATESSELPMGVQMDEIDFDSLTKLAKFR